MQLLSNVRKEMARIYHTHHTEGYCDVILIIRYYDAIYVINSKYALLFNRIIEESKIRSFDSITSRIYPLFCFNL